MSICIYIYRQCGNTTLTGNGALIRGCGWELFLFLFLVKGLTKFFALLALNVVGEANTWPKSNF